LLKYAAALIPKAKHGETPVYIMATAGLRLLDARSAVKHSVLLLARITAVLYMDVLFFTTYV